MTVEQAVRLTLPADEVEPKLAELQRLGIALEASAEVLCRWIADFAAGLMAWLREMFAPVVRWLFPTKSKAALRLSEMRRTVDLRASQRAARKRRRR